VEYKEHPKEAPLLLQWHLQFFLVYIEARGGQKGGGVVAGGMAVVVAIYTGGACRRPPRWLGPTAMAHGGKLSRAHTQESTVGGSLTAVGHGGWTRCRRGLRSLALSAVAHDSGGIVLINFKTVV
jgi:hypothetical protein